MEELSLEQHAAIAEFHRELGTLKFSENLLQATKTYN